MSDDRKESYVKFEKYLKKLGFDYGNDIERLEAIKRLNFKQFCQLLSTSNSFLRGIEIKKWNDKKSSQVGGELFGGRQIIPQPNPDYLFKILFEDLKSNITVDNCRIYAVKMYFAIILAHMFKDGNGRLSRNAYSVISGNLDKLLLKSSYKLQQINLGVFHSGLIYLFNNNGIPIKSKKDLFKFEFKKKKNQASYPLVENFISYLAFRNLLIKFKKIDKNNLSKILVFEDYDINLDDYKISFDKILNEFFWSVLKVVDMYSDLFIENLDNCLYDKS